MTSFSVSPKKGGNRGYAGDDNIPRDPGHRLRNRLFAEEFTELDLDSGGNRHCERQSPALDKTKSPDSADARENFAKAPAAEAFGRLADVAGIGITRVGEGYGLKVNLSHLPPDADPLPTEIAGVPVRVEVVGRIGKQTD
jgi:hypothetical protein